jgi:hypothetical protein
LCEISILKYCFVVKLFEKWRISPPPPRMAPQFGASFWRFGCSIWRLPMRKAPNLIATGGGGRLGLPSRGLSQNHKEYSVLPRSPYLHDFSLMFFMLDSPLDTALILVLLQPSGDGYFRLYSSKSRFRGTIIFLYIVFASLQK